jgi:hypothetical protein
MNPHQYLDQNILVQTDMYEIEVYFLGSELVLLCEHFS